MLMVKDERDSPTDEAIIVLFIFEQVPIDTLQLVFEVTVKSGDGAEIEMEVSELRNEEWSANGVLIVRVIFEFS
jgi:hypothetical protein